jgi:hypothetical protein
MDALRVFMDRCGNPGHTGGVCHGQIGAGLQRQLAADFNLAALMGHECAVGHVDDANAVYFSDIRDDPLLHVVIACRDGHVPDNAVVPEADDVDGADVAARFADGGGDPAEHAGFVGDFQTDQYAVAEPGCLHHKRNLLMALSSP